LSIAGAVSLRTGASCGGYQGEGVRYSDAGGAAVAWLAAARGRTRAEPVGGDGGGAEEAPKRPWCALSRMTRSNGRYRVMAGSDG
jgi:hypothetical protein